MKKKRKKQKTELQDEDIWWTIWFYENFVCEYLYTVEELIKKIKALEMFQSQVYWLVQLFVQLLCWGEKKQIKLII